MQNDPNGIVWDSPAPAGPTQIIPPRQKLPAPQTPAQGQKDVLEVQNLQGQIDARNAERARGGLSPKDYADLQGRQVALGDFGKLVDDLEQRYAQQFEGGDKGGVFGIGGDRNIAGYLPNIVSPENKTFNDTADSLIGAIAKAQGATGGEMNSLAEMRARFGPMIPSSSDSDENIKAKIQRLRDMAIGQQRGVEAQLGRAMTNDGQVVLNPGPSSGEQISGGTGNLGLTGGAHVEENPALSGANAKINEMIKAGRPNSEIIGVLKAGGMTNASLVAVMSQLMKIREFQKSAPDYTGDYQVDVERREVPNSAWNNIAAQPVAAAPIAAADTLSGGHLDNIVGMTGGDADMANVGIGLARDQNPLASLVGDMGAGAAMYVGGAGAAGRMGLASQGGKVSALSPRALGADAAMGGYVASGQGGTQIIDPMQTAKGAFLGAGAGAGVRGGLNTAGAAISPTGGALAPIYEAGGRPTIGQRMGASDSRLGRAFNRAEEAFTSVPLLGSVQRSARNNAVDEMQRGAFNQALGEIGLKLPKGVSKGTQAHSFMQRSFDKAYDKARSGMRFAPDGEWTNDLAALMPDVQLLSKDSQNTFRQMVGIVGGKLKASGGVLTGDQYKIVSSRIGKKVASLRSNPSGDTELADTLESLGQAIDDAARRQSPADSVKLLDAADAGYAKSVVIENAGRARGGEAGEFNGTQLDSSVQRTNKSRRSRAYLRGEANMQDYGTAAKKLGNEVPDSGTTERALALGGMGALAKFVDPVLLAPWAANTAATLPGVRQALGAAMAPRPKSIRGGTDKARGILEILGRYGAPATSVPVVTE